MSPIYPHRPLILKPLARISQIFIASPSLRWLSLALICLHLSVVLDQGQPWSRAFMLAHYGFFLLWQPFLQGEQKLDVRLALPVFALAAVLVLTPGWWVVGLWVAVLIGLTGAVVAGVSGRGQRFMYTVALAYLLALLLVWLLPKTLPSSPLPAALTTAVRWGLLPLPLLILFKGGREVRHPGSTLDLFYGVMVFLIVVVLALGTLTVVAASGSSYVLALIETLIAMAALLITLSLLWNPRAGFAGMGQLMSRYLLSVGLPFEDWARKLAVQAERERDPETFVIDALRGLDELDWVRGVDWRTVKGEGRVGKAGAHTATHGFHGLTLSWHTNHPLPPALTLHVRLLSQLLGYFYASKVREQTLRDNAYTQAIFDTGARLTHDVKNILQSLRTLMAAAEASGPEDADRLQGLIKRQLPQMAQRLQSTVDKLRQPSELDHQTLQASDWWANLQNRYAHDQVAFDAGPLPDDVTIPQDLFDSVADNLLTNALRKRREQAGVEVRVTLKAEPDLALRVEDTGQPAPDHVARNLFHAPVASDHGLGVGLFQATRQAAKLGYELVMEENRLGAVRIALRKRPS
jgi:signal transduction histidine kinase